MKEKDFKIKKDDLRKIIDSEIGCIASDMITVHGEPVGYMYREEPVDNTDSGWRFFSGNESQEYADDEDNFSFYKLNTIANYDHAIIAYLELPIGKTLERKEGADVFIVVEDE